ncbi:MAG: cytochrome C oxidase subunit II [Deltaproteobacteria bacterium]|nr:cytochrome C oxidase subunit II [Deltaproteobacteria bacterium]
MSISAPPKDWFQAPSGAERLWIGLALSWCLIMFVTMPYWHLKGKQNSTGESYRVEKKAFRERVERFVEQNKVGEDNGVPVVAPAPGSDIYLLAQMFDFYPVLKLKLGQTYRLHVSSADVQHGLSLLPMNMNFQAVPGYDHVLTLTPTSSGPVTLVCNEFCGIGHHKMTGKMIVE